jgi:phosphoribosyl 1,2-cyclic phosphate phosphodiesterase
MLARRRGLDGETVALIDTSPDFRMQMLAAEVKTIDAVLYTHDHADQTHGIDDLRTFAIRRRQRIPAWMDQATHAALTHRFAYIFETQHGYPPLLEAQEIPPHGQAWAVTGPGGDIPIVTFDMAHGPIRSAGYRLGDVSYSSDVSDLDDAALEAVKGSKLWIVDALRWTPHPTHAHVDKALEWIERAGVERAVLTNLHIDLDYRTLSSQVPAHVEVGFDGWSASVPL